MEITKETILRAKAEPQVLEEVAKKLQLMIVMLYFNAAQDAETTDDESQQEAPDALLC